MSKVLLTIMALASTALALADELEEARKQHIQDSLRVFNTLIEKGCSFIEPVIIAVMPDGSYEATIPPSRIWFSVRDPKTKEESRVYAGDRFVLKTHSFKYDKPGLYEERVFQPVGLRKYKASNGFSTEVWVFEETAKCNTPKYPPPLPTKIK